MMLSTPSTTTTTFNGLFSRTTWVSRHQKGKPFWILLEQEMMWWQWHQLDHMEIICTSLQTYNQASTFVPQTAGFLQDCLHSPALTLTGLDACFTVPKSQKRNSSDD